jgi:hypothetical protein
MKGKELRTDDLIVQIKLAFMGAVSNLYLLEEKLAQIGNISLYQYSNYLSQVAFCIELGLKSVIINTDNVEHTHEIEYLFSRMPQEFQENFRSLYPNDKTFESNMTDVKEIYIDFKYMQTESNLRKYLEENIINSNGTINFKLVINLPIVQFLQNLLDKIMEYIKSE